MAIAAPTKWFPRRGELYFVQLEKRRPGIVLSVDWLNEKAFDATVVPLTTREKPFYPLRILIPAGIAGIRRTSWAKCDQVTTLEKSRFYPPALGAIPYSILREIEAKVKVALGLR